MSAPRGPRAIASAALLASVLAAAARADSQACAPLFLATGSFGPPGATVVGAWDFDRDGRPDLVVATNGEIRLVHNTGGPLVLGSALFSGSVAVADFDGDGFLDVVSVSAAPASVVSFFRGDGRGGFRLASSFTATAALSSPVPGDFDGDGRLDLAALEGSVYTVTSALAFQAGDGAGQFGPPALFPVPATVSRESAVVTAVDVDGDGRPDLVLSGLPGVPPLVFHNACRDRHAPVAPGPARPAQRRNR